MCAVYLKLTIISTTNNTHLESSDLVLSANLVARKARHQKVFAGAKVLSKILPIFGAVKNSVAGVKASRHISGASASTKLFRSYSVAVVALLVIGAINPENVYSQSSAYAPALDGVAEYYDGGSLLASDDGYIPKINPQTELADRTSTNGKLIHEVASGETISTIAEEYGLKTNTVLWENGLSSTSTLKIGQQLAIPPVDGISHVVDKSEDVKKIAMLYGVDANAVIKQNQLGADAKLTSGQLLFIPGAKPLPVDTTGSADRNAPSRAESFNRINSTVRINTALNPDAAVTRGAVRTKSNIGSSQLVAGSDIGSSSDATPVGGKLLIFPTIGKITQGFHAGHYAFDIADRAQPPIWSAADGIVVKASSGTWGGGYGNHVIIDHGNGLKTLYGHMEYLSVSEGDHVTRGQVIGKMGHTGNVRGVTGIHLHFEVIQNGVKKSPANFF